MTQPTILMMSAMRTGLLLSLLMTVIAFGTEPGADADSMRQPMPRQALNSGLPLPTRIFRDTLFKPDSSCLGIPCGLALGAWDAVGRGRACENPAPCLAIGFVLVICALLVLSGVMHP
jgi:hypothetical protein